jgi:hypothetical protein
MHFCIEPHIEHYRARPPHQMSTDDDLKRTDTASKTASKGPHCPQCCTPSE